MTRFDSEFEGIPRYEELMSRQRAPAGSAWGVFGDEDEVGTINFITPDCVRHAATLVNRGVTFNLDKPLDGFDPPVAKHRHKPRHTMISNSDHHRDDYIDGFYLQASTQVDSLRHFRHPDHGFYNGVRDDDIHPDTPTIGVNRYAERAIVGRGVLVDVDRYLRTQGRTLDHRAGEAFPVSLLDEVAAAQGVAFRRGDILLMRTGWMSCYFNEMSQTERNDLPNALKSTGLLQARETLAWLWDHGISIGASDNAGFEAIPSVPTSPFVSEFDKRVGAEPIHAGLMHPTMIALMGLCLGELWDLEALAADCANTGVYECMVSCKPLNLTGGVGSPANAIAIV
jgi:kynurenine formamidase